MIKDLQRIEKLYNCSFHSFTRGEQEFLELDSVNRFTHSNLIHIEHILKQFGFYFYMVEAIDDTLMLTYYKK